MGTLRLYELPREVQKLMGGGGWEHPPPPNFTASQVSSEAIYRSEVASSPGHSQILSRSRGEKSGEDLVPLLCHGPEMVDPVST